MLPVPEAIGVELNIFAAPVATDDAPKTAILNALHPQNAKPPIDDAAGKLTLVNALQP